MHTPAQQLPGASTLYHDPVGQVIRDRVFSPHTGYIPPAPRVMTALKSLYPPVTVANTLTETTIYSANIPLDYFNQGMDLRLAGMGIHSATATPTVQIRVYKGSTVLLDTGAVLSGNSTNALIEIRAHISGQSSTSVWSQGYYKEFGGGANDFQMVNTAATTISSAAETLTVTFQWGTASMSNTVTWTNFVAYLAPLT